MPPTGSAGPVPREALDYWDRKGVAPSFNHFEVWKREHSTAFAVAKVMETDILTDIRNLTRKALAEGQTFREWRANALPELAKAEHWLPSTEQDRGIPSRLAVIFFTNMRVARSVGQWERIERTKESRPYLEYGLGPSDKHRDEHVGWEGTILHVDDPFWDTHFVPNGWG